MNLSLRLKHNLNAELSQNQGENQRSLSNKVESNNIHPFLIYEK
ncbi:hypothetical protein BTHERMOSOX_1200 [Bathymodiolus thermophilus thioautotrophic gill symbiont]|nr:hypothetical protein BTHERMOSOX_1200 [Bathymodiolus thermophilus thioautotrophic gill symbiont]